MVDLVPRDHLRSPAHDRLDKRCTVPLWTMLSDRLIRNVVRRGASHVEVADALGDQEVAVRDAGMKREGIAGEERVEIRDQVVGLILGNVTCREILHPPVEHGDEVAPENDPVGPDGQPTGRRLQRGAAGVVPRRVVAEHR
jgi:hypothetical protein